jgi:hypothetical protein
MNVSRVACVGWAAVVVGSAVAPGCGSAGGSGFGPEDNPTTVRDVTGVEFGWDCGSKGCQVAIVDGTPPPDPCGGGERAAYSYAWGRFFDLCSVCVSSDTTYWSTSPGQCRILACDTSDDCPVIYPYAMAYVYECVNGLCQDADQNRWPRTPPLSRTETEQLCFAVHDRTETNSPFGAGAMQVEAELDASCTGTYPMDTCTLPAGCRTP